MDSHPPLNILTRKPNTAAESKHPKLLLEKLPYIQVSKPQTDFADCKSVDKVRSMAIVDFQQHITDWEVNYFFNQLVVHICSR